MACDTNVLFLASASPSRQRLLTEARIPFVVVEHTCDERSVQQEGSIEYIVEHLACCKASAAVLPPVDADRPVFVLAADTFASDMRGELYGKPSDYESAVATLKALRDGARATTGYCCRLLVNNEIVTQVTGSVSAYLELNMTDKHIELYLAGRPDFRHIAGAIAIDDFGAQFVRTVNGSYTTVIGLPMSQVRDALEEVGFFG